jgi:hypothetical protein
MRVPAKGPQSPEELPNLIIQSRVVFGESFFGVAAACREKLICVEG